jgi:hypothetical protein
MTPIQATLLIIFGVVGFMMIVDPNVSEYLTLVLKMTRLNIERFFWMVKFHPRNPITNLIKRWEYAKIATELQKEFDDARIGNEKHL